MINLRSLSFLTMFVLFQHSVFVWSKDPDVLKPVSKTKEIKQTKDIPSQDKVEMVEDQMNEDENDDELTMSPINDRPGEGREDLHDDNADDEDVTVLEQQGPHLVRPSRSEEDENDKEFLEKGEVEGEEEERALANHHKDVENSDFEEVDIEKE
jgi:hypothetical protein